MKNKFLLPWTKDTSVSRPIKIQYVRKALDSKNPISIGRVCSFHYSKEWFGWINAKGSLPTVFADREEAQKQVDKYLLFLGYVFVEKKFESMI
jgi:hypothetical protein